MQGMRLLGSATASTNGMQLFKPQQLPAASAAAEAASHGQRGLRGTTRCAGAAAATGGAGVSIVRAVDVYLAVHVEGMPQQVWESCGRISYGCIVHTTCLLALDCNIQSLCWMYQATVLFWCGVHLVCLRRASLCVWRLVPQVLCGCSRATPSAHPARARAAQLTRACRSRCR